MKGQAYSVFKMLIGAVFALALLSIVYLIATQIGCPYSSFETVRELVLDASRAPGSCFERQSVCFEGGTVFTESAFEANLPGMDISFHPTSRGVSCTSSTCEIKDKYTIPVCVECSSFSVCKIYINEVCP